MDVHEITSQKNTQIKLLRKLAQKKYRRQRNQFTVENLAIIYDALKSGYDFTGLFVTNRFIEKNQEKFAFLQEHSKINFYYLIDEVLNKSYSQLDTPSGITAIYDIQSKSLNKMKSVLYLNGLKDPGNIGTIMRTALAFDVPNIVLDAGCVDIYNFKAINAAKDAIFKVNIYEDKEGTWLDNKKNILSVYVAHSHQGVPLSEIQRSKNFCLILGNETRGVSEALIKFADKEIHIPISKQIESLNVSVAAAILLHGLQNQNER